MIGIYLFSYSFPILRVLVSNANYKTELKFILDGLMNCK